MVDLIVHANKSGHLNHVGSSANYVYSRSDGVCANSSVSPMICAEENVDVTIHVARVYHDVYLLALSHVDAIGLIHVAIVIVTLSCGLSL